ncbi:TnsD family Tn7-like transposition protein, partial [Cohnella thermotolerans]|uniref:TnsD family Tn7-like transposition protein n=1 Tax=Cohnella thermotolerans TaxID=329858 RepID=UPI00047E537C
MINFPSPYEDEILYSLLARYGIRSGNTSHRAVLHDVFGSDDFTACLELQPGIGRMISNLPVRSTITAEQLIYRNTLYLFYTAFRNAEQAQSIFNEMLGEHGRDIHNAIGLMSSSVKPHDYFQYCPLCNQDDLKKHGELYWRRIHQIPGVSICVKHGIWLSKSQVPIRGTTKYVFTAPTQKNCLGNIVHEVTDKNLLGQYSCIVNDIERLLNNNYPKRRMDWFYLCYKKQLLQKGYASEKGRVDHKRLQKDFIEFYDMELLDILQSSVIGESNWLKLIFQKHRKGFHPVRHLLAMHFLGLSLDDVFHAEESQLIIERETKGNRPKRKIMKKTMTKEYKDKARNERRDAWLQMRNQYPNLGRLELRKLNPKVYAWLYLYDREFLMNNMPEMLPKKAGSLRYDWEARCNAPQCQDTIFREISYVLLPVVRMRFACHRG